MSGVDRKRNNVESSFCLTNNCVRAVTLHAVFAIAQ